MNVYHSQIRELYAFELGHNAAETTKNICYTKDKGAVDDSTVTRWFKKFRLVCKNRNDWVKSGKSKIVDSEDVFQIHRSKSDELGILQFRVFYHIQDLSKST